MKLKETPSYTPHSIDIETNYDEIGNDHVAGSVDTPLRSDAFDMSDKMKKQIIAKHFAAIMETLGLDLTDDSLMGTPHRVAKMYIDEIFYGLDPKKQTQSCSFWK